MNSPNPNTTWFSEKKIVGSQPKFDTKKNHKWRLKFDEGIGLALTAVVSFANIMSYNNEKKDDLSLVIYYYTVKLIL